MISVVMRFSIVIFAVFLACNVHAYSGGSGTLNDPYLISNLSDLRQLSETTADWNSKYFTQTQDIDAGATQGWNLFNHDYNPSTPPIPQGFSPIGNSVTQFLGEYDGGGYVIRNIFINRPNTEYVGLFGYVKKVNGLFTPKVSNIHLKDANITGQAHVGILVGRFHGYREAITSCSATGAVNASGGAVGGLAGSVYWSTVQNSHSSAKISVDQDDEDVSVGGLIGSTERYSKVNGSTADSIITVKLKEYVNPYRSYIGGFVGDGVESVNSSSTGNITVTGTRRGVQVGGFFGAGSTAKNCFTTVNLVNNTDKARLGGFSGGSATSENCFAVGKIINKSNGTLIAGFSEPDPYAGATNSYSMCSIGSKGFNNKIYFFGGSSQNTNCYAAGYLAVDKEVMGFSSGVSSFYDAELFGVDNPSCDSSVCGMSTSNFNQEYNFPWSFSDTPDDGAPWVIKQNVTYPYLYYQNKTYLPQKISMSSNLSPILNILLTN